MQGSNLVIEHHVPVGVFPLVAIKLKQAVALDATVVVGLVAVYIPLPATVHVRGADTGAGVFDQVKAVSSLHTDVSKVDTWCLPEGTLAMKDNHEVLYSVSVDLTVQGLSVSFAS